MEPSFRPWSPAFVHLVRGPILQFLRLVLFFLGPVRSIGRNSVPKRGGLLILANHRSDIDPVVVQAVCDRHVRFMAKSELFQMGPLGPMIRWAGAFPVRRGEPDRTSLRFCLELLRAGEAVVVFPEGKLSADGMLQPMKPGIALLARQSGAATVCIRLEGTEKIIPYGSLIPRPAFRTVFATWSEPRSFTRDASPEEILNWTWEKLGGVGPRPVAE